MTEKKKEYTFIKGDKPSVVWNPKEGRPLVEFCDANKRVTGHFVTTDVKIVKVLREMGYKELKDFPNGPPQGGFEPTKVKVTPDLIPSGISPELRADLLENEEDAVIDRPLKRCVKSKGQIKGKGQMK